MSVMVESAPAGDEMSGECCFEHWRMWGCRWAADMTSDDRSTFTAQSLRHELGPVTFGWTSCPPVRVRRTERMIRHSDEGLYHLTMLTAGEAQVGLHTTGRVEAVGAWDLVLTSSSHPYETRFLSHPDADTGSGQPRVEGVGIDLPASLVPIPAHRVHGLLGRKLSGQEGAGALLAQFMIGLSRQAVTLQPGEASRLGMVTADLLSAVIARELDAENALTPEARQQVLVDGVRTYICGRLQDPDLSPPVIAAAHNLSLSHLHSLFTRHSQGETVAAFIRGQRLKKAYRDLADPALHALPIQAVALRCGMPRASDFARAFKAAHGLTPREHRNRALAAAVVE
ncbi:helix-turn-helix domain-containing protein [Kitasatospora griseola]|uniref:helix-turn-helix domain-containing protein n=1 Tax=Kitasatospora griseola TaxID=2064 RepID=UPI003855C479